MSFDTNCNRTLSLHLAPFTTRKTISVVGLPLVAKGFVYFGRGRCLVSSYVSGAGPRPVRAQVKGEQGAILGKTCNGCALRGLVDGVPQVPLDFN